MPGKKLESRFFQETKRYLKKLHLVDANIRNDHTMKQAEVFLSIWFLAAFFGLLAMLMGGI